MFLHYKYKQLLNITECANISFVFYYIKSNRILPFPIHNYKRQQTNVSASSLPKTYQYVDSLLLFRNKIPNYANLSSLIRTLHLSCLSYLQWSSYLHQWIFHIHNHIWLHCQNQSSTTADLTGMKTDNSADQYA